MCFCPGSRWPAPPWQGARLAPPAPDGSGKKQGELLSKRFLKQDASIQTSHTCADKTFLIVQLIYGGWKNRSVTQRNKKNKTVRLVVTHRYSSMVTGAAGNENKSPTSLDLFDVVLQSSQSHWKASQTGNSSFCTIIFHLIRGHKDRINKHNHWQGIATHSASLNICKCVYFICVRR